MPGYRTPLQPFLEPPGCVLFGASPRAGSLGHALLDNLGDGPWANRLHLVAPGHGTIAGRPCHASLADIDASLSLALIATPAETVAEIVAACARRGIRAAVVFAAGLRPSTAAGARLRAIAAQHEVRVFGPQALGYILPHARLNVSPIRHLPPAGNLALLSQSAAVCANILDWNVNDEFGFSAVFAPGESDDLELPEILDYLASDPRSESILLYLEGLRDARGFLSAVRAAASSKPVIAVKAGKGPLSARVAAAHSGARVDRDDAFAAALSRAGVLRVASLGDMFSAARALTTPRKPRSNRLAIVCNGGGPAVMALDQAERLAIAPACLEAQTTRRLQPLLPASWSAGNPVDVGFAGEPGHFVGAIGHCLDDPGVDAVLAILTPNGYIDPLAVAEATITAVRAAVKPVFTCWLGERQAGAARAALARARLPTFRTPENAVAAFAFMVNWVRNQALLLEMPPALSSYVAPRVDLATAIIDSALAERRTALTLPEAKAVLTAFHIPVSQTLLAHSPTEAVQIANQLGYPLAMKAALPAGAPKTAGGVILQLHSAPAVALAFRQLSAGARAGCGVLIEPQVSKPDGRWLAIGIRQDRLFGPVITLSESGIAPVIYDARAVALPPLNARLIDAMLDTPHVARLLGALPGKRAVAAEPLRHILQRSSEMASELPWLRRMEIASLIADSDDAVVVDVHLELRPLPAQRERYGHMAISPYPTQLEGEAILNDGSCCTLRPLRPEDAAALQAFVRQLSAHRKRLRFFSALSELPLQQLARYAQIDYGRDMVIVASRNDGGQTRILGEARYSILMDGSTGEFALVVADAMSGRGLGRRLMERLIAAARGQGLALLRGEVLADNDATLRLLEGQGFLVRLTDDKRLVEVILRLR